MEQKESMTSDLTIWLDMEPYLRQWFIHEQGGEVPVRLKKGSPDSNIIYTFLQVPPKGEPKDVERDGTVAIVIPCYKYKNIKYCNYLSPHAREMLHYEIRNRFLVELWEDLHKFGNIGKQKMELIYAWMESHGIEATETNYFAVQKIYQRLRDNQRLKNWREKS